MNHGARLPAAAESPFFSRKVICAGWAHEGGTGTIEFYTNMAAGDSNWILVRTDQGNGAYGSVNATIARADDALRFPMTIRRDKDPMNLSSSFQVTLAEGQNVKTTMIQENGNSQLSCTSQ